LLVAQVAMSMVLLAGSGLMIRTIAELAGVHPGFDPKNLLTLEYRLPKTEYAEVHKQWNFHQQVAERVEQLPGVRSVSIAIGIPFTGNFDLEPIVLLDRQVPPPGQEPIAQTNIVDTHYFATLGIPLIEGRTFLASDGDATPSVAVINRTMAEKFWSNGSALGRHVELLDEKKPATIVGVVGDIKVDRLDEKPEAQIYFAYAQHPDRFATLIVRTASEPMSFVGAVRDAVWSVDKNQPMWKVRSMEAVMKDSVGDRRYLAYLLTGYSILATFLAAVGIYGVLSYSVNRRMREIGVRIALGAQTRETLGLVIRQGMTNVGMGMLAGLAGSIALTRTLAGLLYGVNANDPATIAGAVFVLGMAGLLACWIPARRATKVDPMIVLRHE
jgi:predicted permease